ncbi:MAG: ribbon-helix-helix domain-containing protein [Candidatus Peregrinibacteria bacterium]|nr:ribbon-helix-helix domain-containing protein [Candidatus Peregrinibacteria bacterium]
MSALKEKISITMDSNLLRMLDDLAKELGISRSALIETSIQKMARERLREEAKIIANTPLDDVFSEKEWAKLQTPLPEWK